MHSTMQEFPLTIAAILRYATTVHGDRTVTTATGGGGYRRFVRPSGAHQPECNQRDCGGDPGSLGTRHDCRCSVGSGFACPACCHAGRKK